MNQDILATVDLGSNSFRLQICRNDNGQLVVLDSLKEVVRLGAGLDEDKMLSKSAQERALVCLAQFAERLRGFQISQVRVVATNTFRVAKNIGEFLKKATEVLGFPIEIIAGREEARLIYVGVAHTLPLTDEKRLVVDIGGGSTEFILGRRLDALITESLPLGCVSYSLRYFEGGKITPERLQSAVFAARNEIQRISPELKQKGWELAIGTSGSARSIRDILAAGKPEETFITLDAMYALADRIIKAGSVKEANIKHLKSDRVEVLAGGLAIMIAIFEELSVSELSVKDVALREGVLYDLLGRSLSQDMRDTTVAHFEKQYSVDKEQAERVADVVNKLLNVLDADADAMLLEENHKYLLWAAKLHEIGVTISHTAYHKHSSYIIANADMSGFSRFDQRRIARLVLGHRGDLKKMKEQVNTERVWLSVLIFRLAALFCRGRKDVKFPKNIRLEHTPEKIRLHIEETWLQKNPLTTSALLQEQMQWAKIKRKFSVKGVVY